MAKHAEETASRHLKYRDKCLQRAAFVEAEYANGRKGLRVCSQCLHSATGDICKRSGKRQFYELQYTDTDFCGPNRRYFKAVPK